MEGWRVPTQRWGGGWIFCGGCGHVGFAQLQISGECYRLGAAGTLSVPNMPVGRDRRDRGVGLAASKPALHRLLAPAAGLERAPSQRSSDDRKGNECCCNQVDGGLANALAYLFGAQFEDIVRVQTTIWGVIASGSRVVSRENRSITPSIASQWF